MRIVGGEFRGRPLAAPSGRETRPTSDRLRETLFDILAHGLHRHGMPDRVAGARVLDLFAGTGALALEALSRGAAMALLVEDGAEARGLIRKNVETLGLTGRARIYRRDATRLGPVGTLKPFTLAFADPPYGKGLGEAALASALAGGWLEPDALCVLEESAASVVSPPAGFDLLESRTIGDSAIHLMRASGAVALKPKGKETPQVTGM
jgi:16S rRNA (guanine966-N2)-methyltransferase